MRFVVIGGTGLIGSKVVTTLQARGHEVIAASPNRGIDAVTGKGLAEALAGAQVVVNVANSPSFEDGAVLAFFENVGRNLHAAEARAGVKHHVALSVVGADRIPDSGYMRAKAAQERLIKASGIPYSILRATQFCEFIGAIAQTGTSGDTVRVTSAGMQPIAAADVAAALVDVALSPAENRTLEVGGPEALGMDEIVRRYLSAQSDHRRVITDDAAPYFGAVLDERSLLPGPGARLAPTRLDEWLYRNASRPQAKAS